MPIKEKFVLAILWLNILAGLTASWQILSKGIGVTNLNNHFVFGIWIIFDLTFIALGSGAFCTSFSYYILGLKQFKPLLPLSTALGFLCYISAGGILLLEIGQPLRAWFPFWHPNFQSMLTEITFCITLYSLILFMEFLPYFHNSTRQHKRNNLKKILYRLIPALALLGTILSIMHQGSLGGVYGVLFARPFAWRPVFFIWPWTFVLFLISAMATGPLLTIFTARLIEKLSGKSIIGTKTQMTVSRSSSFFLLLYFTMRIADIFIWKYLLLPQKGISYEQMFHNPVFGKWLILLELLLTLLPALVLLSKKSTENIKFFNIAVLLACTGLVISRCVINLQTLAVPSLPFEPWYIYMPNWQEIAPCLMGLSLIILGLRILYKKDCLFNPQK